MCVVRVPQTVYRREHGYKNFEHNRACGGLELGKQQEPCHREQMVVYALQYEIDKAFKKEFGEALSSGAVHELLARLALQNDSMYARFVEQQVRAACLAGCLGGHGGWVLVRECVRACVSE